MDSKLFLKKEKVYVPKNKVLRLKIIQLYHNVLIAKYKEKQKMTELVMRNYQQLGVIRDVRQYVESCDLYQRIKNCIESPVGKQMTITNNFTLCFTDACLILNIS